MQGLLLAVPPLCAASSYWVPVLPIPVAPATPNFDLSFFHSAKLPPMLSLQQLVLADKCPPAENQGKYGAQLTCFPSLKVHNHALAGIAQLECHP